MLLQRKNEKKKKKTGILCLLWVQLCLEEYVILSSPSPCKEKEGSSAESSDVPKVTLWGAVRQALSLGIKAWLLPF